MIRPIVIELIIAESQQQYDLYVVELNVPVAIGMESVIVSSVVPDYDGEYDIIPSSIAQVFPTEGKRILHDFIVEPIPPNYGLITWNGSIITVS